MRSIDFVHVFIEKGDVGLFLQYRDDIDGIYERNKLGVFGGHVDPTDVSFLAAAERELNEETGLQNRIIRALGVISIIGPTLAGEVVNKIVHGFAVTVEPDVEIPVYEGQGGVLLAFGQPIPEKPELTETARLELDKYYRGKFQQ